MTIERLFCLCKNYQK